MQFLTTFYFDSLQYNTNIDVFSGPYIFILHHCTPPSHHHKMNFNQSVHIKHGRCSKMQLHGILSKMKTDRDLNVSLICIVLFNPLTCSFVNFFYIALKSSKPCQPFLSSYSVSWEQHIIQNLNSDCNNPGRWQSLLPFSSFRLTAFPAVCVITCYVYLLKLWPLLILAFHDRSLVLHLHCLPLKK